MMSDFKEKMRAIVVNGPDDYGIQMVDIPKPGPGEVLCRVRACAICGSDVGLFEGHYHETKGWPRAYPIIFGHEWSGEVVALGEGAEQFQIGDHVAGEAHSGCGLCENCRNGEYTLCENYGRPNHRHYGFTVNGAYAEYEVYRENALTRMPDNVSFDEATMCDTAGVALHANRVGNVGSNDVVVIYGPGPIGNTAMQLAKAKGAFTIMVGRRERLQLAKACGADLIFDYEQCNPEEEIRKVTHQRGATVVMECAGSDAAVQNCFRVAAKNARVVLVAIPKNPMVPLPVDQIMMDQLHVSGSRANPNCSAEVLDHIARGQLNAKKLITHRFPMERMREALDTFKYKKDGAMKVLIEI